MLIDHVGVSAVDWIEEGAPVHWSSNPARLARSACDFTFSLLRIFYSGISKSARCVRGWRPPSGMRHAGRRDAAQSQHSNAFPTCTRGDRSNSYYFDSALTG